MKKGQYFNIKPFIEIKNNKIYSEFPEIASTYQEVAIKILESVVSKSAGLDLGLTQKLITTTNKEKASWYAVLEQINRILLEPHNYINDLVADLYMNYKNVTVRNEFYLKDNELHSTEYNACLVDPDEREAVESRLRRTSMELLKQECKKVLRNMPEGKSRKKLLNALRKNSENEMIKVLNNVIKHSSEKSVVKVAKRTLRLRRPKTYEELMAQHIKYMESVWQGNKNNESITQFYPYKQHKKFKVPENCFMYHHTMISEANISKYDLDEAKCFTSYTRFAFPSMYNVWQKLKGSPIENCLLMEYTTGMGYVNYLYDFVSGWYGGDIDSVQVSEVYLLQELIQTGGRIKEFFIRRMIMDLLFSSIALDDENTIKNAVTVLKHTKKVVDNIYMQVYWCWWEIFCCLNDKKVIDNMRQTIEDAWDQYFQYEKAYKDTIKQIGINDWRGIASIDNCFFKKMETNIVYGADIFYCYNAIGDYWYTDKNGISKCFLSGVACNEIGRKIENKVHNKLKKARLSSNPEKAYKRFEYLRNKEFEKLKFEDQKKFENVSVKVGKTVNSLQVYAILQNEALKTLLGA